MIVFVGDIHGQFRLFGKILKNKNIDKDATVIQVGDFGFWPMYERYWHRLEWLEKPIYFIDGNHEHHPSFKGLKEPTELWDGLVYVPRGTVLEIDGKKIGFLGGAASVDYRYRTPGYDWFPEEAVHQSDIDKLWDVEGLDILVTHSPPNRIIQKNFRHISEVYPSFISDPKWFDPSAVAVEQLWDHLGKPLLVCGHMHRQVNYQGVRILDINEVYIV